VTRRSGAALLLGLGVALAAGVARGDGAAAATLDSDAVAPAATRPLHPHRARPGLREFWSELAARSDVFESSWFQEQFATGDWGGVRSRLAERGVITTLTYQADVQANVSGGLHRAGRYFHNVALDLELDLQKLAGLTGTRFHVSMSQRSGQDLSEEAVGSVFNVATVCCGNVVKLVSLALEQSFFDGRLDVAVGRLNAGDDFLTTPLDWKFVSNAFDGNPVGVFFQIPFSAYPNATWGARVRGLLTPELQLQLGVYNGDPTLSRDSAHGVDFRWRSGVGLVTVAEVAWLPNQAPGSPGLPGTYKAGVFQHSGPFAVLDAPGESERGNGGFYLHADQMLWREGGAETRQGITPFVWLVYAPDESLSVVPFFANGGVVWRGPIPGRDDDELVLGGVYGWFSPKQRREQERQRAAGADVVPQSFEAALELGYTVQLAKWLELQPDVQYVIRPGAGGELRNALVVGAQVALSF